MLYCPDCKMLFEDKQDVCPICSGPLRIPQETDFIYLLTIPREKKPPVSEMLAKAAIPCRIRAVDPSAEEFRVFVPFGQLDRCRTVLREFLPQKQAGEEFEPMPEGKRRFWRVFSAILFFLLVCVVVMAADWAANLFVSLFQT